MPKVKKVGGSVIHPNSRKAMQLTRMEHRGIKLERRKEESNLKLLSKLRKLKWFKDNIDVSKKSCTTEEVHELIEKYLQRFSAEEKKMEEIKSIKGRHNNERLGHDYKTKFTVERERKEYETNGFEIPNLTKQQAFEYFVNWNGDSKFLPAISMVTVSKSTKCK